MNRVTDESILAYGQVCGSFLISLLVMWISGIRIAFYSATAKTLCLLLSAAT